MKNKYILSLILLAGTVASVSADTVESTPGTLSGAIESAASVEQLALTGAIDASDLYFIAASMPALRTLDLGNVTIAAYSGDRLGNNTVYAAATIPAHVFAGSAITSVTLPSQPGLAIGDAAFAGSALTSVVLGANVATVGHAAFSGCPDLQQASVAAASLGDGAFAGCPALTSVTFTADATLGDNAFAGCPALAAVSGSDRITAIGNRAFADCRALTEFSFSRNLSAIGDEAFVRAGLHDVDLSRSTGIESVGKWAFALMPQLESAVMGNATADEGVVFGCPELKSFEISQKSTEVPDLAYSKNSSLNPAGLIHSNIVRIGNYAMAGLSNISTITLPASLEELGDHAMAGMTGLTAITSSATSVPATGADVWQGVQQHDVRLIVPDGSEDSYRSADQWQNFNILGLSQSADAILGETFAGLRARFEGDLLFVSISDGTDIASLGLYNAAGALLFAGTPAQPLVTIDTAGADDRVFVIVATLTDGRRAALKIAR